MINPALMISSGTSGATWMMQIVSSEEKNDLTKTNGIIMPEPWYFLLSGDEPVKNKVLFKRLHDHSALSWDLRQEMIALVNFRNKVSHHFSELSRDDLEMMYALIPVYKEFLSLMELEHSRARFQTKRNMIIGAVLVAVVLILLWYFS